MCMLFQQSCKQHQTYAAPLLAPMHAHAKPDDGLQLVEPKRLTLAQLKDYDGSDKKRPIYLAIRGIIFDVSKGELYTSSKSHPA